MGIGADIQLSVVIVSYNIKELLLQAVASVKQHVSCTCEVIVIDNNSTDGTGDALEASFGDVKLIHNNYNAGFSAANNQGFAIAKGRFILMLNPDARLANNELLHATEYIEKAGQPVILGAKLLNPDGSLQQSAWKFPRPAQHLIEMVGLSRFIDITTYELGAFSKPTEVDSLSGAFLLFEKKLLSSIGGLDNELFWMDDVDFCYRNKIGGGVNVYYPGLQAVHHIGGSSSKNMNMVIANQLISKLKFYRKHGQTLNFAVSTPIFLLQMINRSVIFLLLSPFKATYFLKLRAYLYTFRRFFAYLIMGDGRVTP